MKKRYFILEKKMYIILFKKQHYRNDFDFPEGSDILPRHFKLKFDEKTKNFMLKAIDPAEIYLRVKEKIVNNPIKKDT